MISGVSEHQKRFPLPFVLLDDVVAVVRCAQLCDRVCVFACARLFGFAYHTCMTLCARL